MDQIPTIGRIVRYRLSAQDSEQVNRRRTTGPEILDLIKSEKWPLGAQAHIGNEVKEGDVFPMLVVKCHGTTPTSAVNGQVFLDGNDTLWVTYRSVGEEAGSFSWPPRG